MKTKSPSPAYYFENYEDLLGSRVHYDSTDKGRHCVLIHAQGSYYAEDVYIELLVLSKSKMDNPGGDFVVCFMEGLRKKYRRFVRIGSAIMFIERRLAKWRFVACRINAIDLVDRRVRVVKGAVGMPDRVKPEWVPVGRKDTLTDQSLRALKLWETNPDLSGLKKLGLSAWDSDDSNSWFDTSYARAA